MVEHKKQKIYTITSDRNKYEKNKTLLDNSFSLKMIV